MGFASDEVLASLVAKPSDFFHASLGFQERRERACLTALAKRDIAAVNDDRKSGSRIEHVRPTQSLKQARDLILAPWVESGKNLRPLSTSLEKPLCLNLCVVCGRLTAAIARLACALRISFLVSSLLLAYYEVGTGDHHEYDEKSEEYAGRETAIHVEA
jgi:hypothetical protein